jgi:hypothetical protein
MMNIAIIALAAAKAAKRREQASSPATEAPRPEEKPVEQDSLVLLLAASAIVAGIR